MVKNKRSQREIRKARKGNKTLDKHFERTLLEQCNIFKTGTLEATLLRQQSRKDGLRIVTLKKKDGNYIKAVHTIGRQKKVKPIEEIFEFQKRTKKLFRSGVIYGNINGAPDQ